jgi:hypothetical protein
MATSLVGSDAAHACPACGDTVAGLGDACDGCGATLGLERSVVEVWRGYTTGTFIARTGEELVAESPSFRCRGRNGPAENEAAHSALAALTTELAGLGWSAAPDDGGPAWYELAFDRLVAIAPVELAEIEMDELEIDDAEFYDEADVETEAPVTAPVGRPVWSLPPALPAAVLPPAVAAPRGIPVMPQPSAPSFVKRALGGRVVTIVSIAGIAVACVLGYVIAHRSTTIETRVVTVSQPARGTKISLSKPTRAVPAAPAKTPLRFGVTATQDTWLELRRGSKSGRVVFSGILPAGEHLHVSGPRIWARFAAAGNADVTVDGRRVALMGTIERLFTAAAR